MTTVKKVNYTPAQEEEMKTVYTSISEDAENDTKRAEVVASLALKFGKTDASIRSKMSREGYYIRPEKVSTATGKKVVRKPVLVAQLADKLGLEGDNRKKVASGEKATKSFLELVIAQMTFLEKRIAEFEAIEEQDIEVSI